MLHKIFYAQDSASLVHLGLGYPVLIHIVGFGIMVSKPGSVTGKTLILASDIAYYVISMIVVNSLFLNPVNRSLQSMTFMSVSTLATIGVVVSGSFTMTKDDSFLMVSTPETYGHYLTQEGHRAYGKLCVLYYESARTYSKASQFRENYGYVKQVPIDNGNFRKNTVIAITLLQHPTA
jgi:hypothetical protein